MIRARELVEIDPSSLRKPIAFVGMPGVANVGKTAALAIARSLESVKCAEVFCTDSPPSIYVRKDGRPHLPRGSTYFSNRSDSPNDAFVFTGDFQPSSNMGQYEYSDYIARTCKHYNVQLLVALAASVLGYIPTERKVWIAGTNRELIDDFSKNRTTKIFRGATISGMNGLAPVIAQIAYNINGICLLADTYPLLTRDPAAAKCLLEVVVDVLKIPLDLSILDEKIGKMQKELGKIEQELAKRPAKTAKPEKSPEYFG
ncbi:MAG: PAC2 family protein [Promethearchaeati archaeon SRVP18_Atabeyarchaeia-1]